MVTSLFASGLTRCLIGTRGLLGEGWDAECLNTLIDLTAVTTSTSVQQLRGRGLRLDSSWPRKVTHNWDVVTVAPEFERGDADLRRFVIRHDRLWGVADNGKVVRGIAHVDRKLSTELAFHSFKSVDYADLDKRMMASLSTREDEYALWSVGEEYSNFAWRCAGIRAPDLKVRTVNTIQDTLRRLIIQFWPAVLTAAVGALVLIFQVGVRSPVAWKQPLEFLLIGLGFYASPRTGRRDSTGVTNSATAARRAAARCDPPRYRTRGPCRAQRLPVFIWPFDHRLRPSCRSG